jgi:hypothetical protein
LLQTDSGACVAGNWILTGRLTLLVGEMCFHVGQGPAHFVEQLLGLPEHPMVPVTCQLRDERLLPDNPLPALFDMPHSLLKVCFSHGEPTAG